MVAVANVGIDRYSVSVELKVCILDALIRGRPMVGS